MSQTRSCPTCGVALPHDAPPGICPYCALRGALAAAHDTRSASRAPPPQSEATASAPPLATPEAPTQRFGDYELLEEIARGGMGIVYRARQISLNRMVALKLLPFSALTSAEFIKRFRAEASAAAAIKHSNIVPVHEVGVHQGQHYLVMDLIHGPPLSRLVMEGPLPPQRAATYLKRIAEALHYAHEQGILHRDLKPSNVLIDENDQPQVTDFGLAKRLDGESSLTLTGQALGSPGYMPPEQAAGQHGKVSRCSDVYGLGAMLYHLLTGRPPFQAGTLNEALQQVVEKDPVAPRLLNPSVPRDLETICIKCLEKEPDRRYPTAQELAEDLGRFLNGEPTKARPLTPLGRGWRWCRRKPLVAVLWVTTAVAVAGGLTLALLGFAAARQESQTALRNAQKSQRIAELLRELIATAEPASGKGQDFTVRDMLDAFSANLGERLADDPDVEIAVRTAVASAYLELYETDTALTHLSRALALVENRLATDPLESAIVYQTFGQYYNINGRDKEAWPYFRKAEVLLRRELPPDHARLLLLRVQLATCYRDAGDFPPAYQLLNEAVAITRRKAGEREADYYRANALRFLTDMYRMQRRFPEARESIAEWRQALTPHHTTSHQLLLLADFQEALVVRAQARLSGDSRLFDEAIARFARLLEAQSKALPEDHIDTLDTRLELACTHFYAGHSNEAVRLILDAYQAAHRKAGPEDDLTRRVLTLLEEIRAATGRPELDAVGRDELPSSTR